MAQTTTIYNKAICGISDIVPFGKTLLAIGPAGAQKLNIREVLLVSNNSTIEVGLFGRKVTKYDLDMDIVLNTGEIIEVRTSNIKLLKVLSKLGEKTAIEQKHPTPTKMTPAMVTKQISTGDPVEEYEAEIKSERIEIMEETMACLEKDIQIERVYLHEELLKAEMYHNIFGPTDSRTMVWEKKVLKRQMSILRKKDRMNNLNKRIIKL